MANTISPIYGFILPEVSADNNLWGTHLNQDLSVGGGGFPTIDQLLARPQLQRAVVTGGVIDLNAGQVFEMTVTGLVTQTFVNVPVNPPGSGTNPNIASVIFVKVINGGTGGIQNVTWAGSITWIGDVGSFPILKTAGVNWIMLFKNNNGANWYGSLLSNGEVNRSIAARVLRGASLSLTTGTSVAIPWDGILFDLDSIASISSTRLTATHAGTYMLSTCVTFNSNNFAIPDRTLFTIGFKKNNSVFLTPTFQVNEVVHVGGFLLQLPYQFDDTVQLLAGDYIEVIVSHNAGNTLTATAMASITRVGP